MTAFFITGCASSPESQSTQAKLQDNNLQSIRVTSDISEGNVPPADRKITMFYIVQTGDTLGKIAKKIYGTSFAWKTLARENNITNPNQIYVGDFIHYELNAKSKAFAESYANVPRSKIIARGGDSLAEIATAIFGSEAEWRTVWKENPQIKNPDKIREGQTIYFKARDYVPSLSTPMTGSLIKKAKKDGFAKKEIVEKAKPEKKKEMKTAFDDEDEDLKFLKKDNSQILIPLDE